MEKTIKINEIIINTDIRYFVDNRNECMYIILNYLWNQCFVTLMLINSPVVKRKKILNAFNVSVTTEITIVIIS